MIQMRVVPKYFYGVAGKMKWAVWWKHLADSWQGHKGHYGFYDGDYYISVIVIIINSFL